MNHKRVRALLGPTNTGKTHYALERMLAYPSGIIGFPLRLLAKENYVRMSQRKGCEHIALITGEEKIIPPKAKWYSCTVEAMPTHIPVDFIAIDEIQLCADPHRGHIFTHRLLHRRGNEETLFLGAETIGPILKRLISGIEIETRPRLSSLLFSGYNKLTKLPPRSAVIAFSANEVYALAELIKRQHGGCAIIMGRLSPKTRNAQMQLYQNKEVNYLVATDAVGMGLNMDVNHIAFANLAKFDGYHYRNLNSSEAAQIAGRAGRGFKNGFFGTTGNCTTFSTQIIQDIETHQFNSLKQLFWRNHLLDFTSPAQLFNSLTQKPLPTYLKAGAPASDLQCLIYLIQDPEIIQLCNSSQKTKLLWENCQIPDFKKIGLEQHAKICKKTFLFLLQYGCIPEPWFQHHMHHLNCDQGDIDTLMQRLSGIRICSYIATKNNWLKNAIYWQKQTKEVENNLSDALHEQLMNRFINQRVTMLFKNLKNHNKSELYTFFSQSGDIFIEGHLIGKVTGFTFKIFKHYPEDEK
ncbi:helicase-related protein, partial [Commensalibacter sp. Nvir]|uniref:helicase-related protein n=1 Tax=Commensalibacter sp. Nvir TaxID=3069817 RepID=UPI0030C81472